MKSLFNSLWKSKSSEEHTTKTFPAWVPLGHPARAILERKEGKKRGRIEYMLILPNDYATDILLWNSLLDTQLIGIGEVDQGHEQLFIASDGRCFGASCIHDAFYYYGESLAHFQGFRLRLKRSQPMLRPNQESVDLYGITFTRQSPELYYPNPKLTTCSR